MRTHSPCKLFPCPSKRSISTRCFFALTTKALTKAVFHARVEGRLELHLRMSPNNFVTLYFELLAFAYSVISIFSENGLNSVGQYHLSTRPFHGTFPRLKIGQFTFPHLKIGWFTFTRLKMCLTFTRMAPLHA